MRTTSQNQKNNCGMCANFVPSVINPVSGLGMCGQLAQWLRRHAERGTKPRPTANGRLGELETIYTALGGKFGTSSALFWPNSDREKCGKYKEIGNDRI